MAFAGWIFFRRGWPQGISASGKTRSLYFFSDRGKPKDIGKSQCRFHFTLLELLIVLVIVSAGLALIGPRIGRLPSRVVIRNAVASLETAFSEAGMRARATGQPVTLVLQPGRNRIALQDRSLEDEAFLGEPYRNQTRSTSRAAEDPDTSNLIYDLDEEIEWGEGEYAFREDENFHFTFFPDGTAAGPDIDLTIRNRSFQLKVARLTGRMRVIELND